ncbi:MAG: hypothetical protein HZA93_13060 [Verrucomicrobia bacterium]|nr:hypothetical protein [Verrucomicrobiota bacterium]
MKSLGEIIASANATAGGAEDAKKSLWQAAVRASEDEFRRKRPYKVTLCTMAWSEVEVVGDCTNVDRLAEQNVDKATVVMHALPFAMRRFVQKRSDPKNPESPLEWVEVVYAPVDALDRSSPWAWQLKKK